MQELHKISANNLAARDCFAPCDPLDVMPMKENMNNNFWEALSAIATFCATLLALGLALFGEKINKFFNGPRLDIELIPLSTEDYVPGGGDIAIYCHLKCSNRRHRSPAKNVKVLLIDVFQEDDGILKNKFASGPIPLHWQYEFVNKEYFPPFPTIATNRIFDLAKISKNENALQFSTHVKLPRTTFGFRGAGRIIATVRAESDETVSRQKNIEIRWNGSWPHIKADIMNNLKFKEISSKELLKELENQA